MAEEKAPGSRSPKRLRTALGWLLALALAAVVGFGFMGRPITVVSSTERPAGTPEQREVLDVMKRAADWQLTNPVHPRSTNWMQATFSIGLLALAETSASPHYYDALRYRATKALWRPGPEAGPQEEGSDDYAVVYAYAKMYQREQKPHMVAPSIALGQHLAKQPYALPLLSEDRDAALNAATADSMFMGPPALAALSAATGDIRYADLANEMFWRTKDYLYDPEAHLYFRDATYAQTLDSNGKHMFWSRSNAFVMAAIARMLQSLPADYPDRSRYEELFRDMADRVVELQSADGYWRASLLNPDSPANPESSGTALFTFALLFGLNQNLLVGPKYADAAERGWKALVAAVQPDGRLGWVQPQSTRPQPTTADATYAFGDGTLLLAGSEMYHYLAP